MNATLFLLRRYLFPGKHNLMGLALWVAVGGVALGVVQLMVVLSVMTGFQNLFQENYTRITSEIVVIPHRPGEPDAIRSRILATPGVAAATPFSLGQGMVLHNGVGGVTLEGIDPETSGKVTPWPKVWLAPPLTDERGKTRYWMWLGVQLANKLGIQQGDTVNVLNADSEAKRIVPFTVTAITKFGIYDHDLRWARIDYSVLQEIFRLGGTSPMYKIKVKAGTPISTVADSLRESFGEDATVKEWSQLNQNIFLAVQHQKKLLFLVLEIVVALAAMNVVNLLMMSSHHRRRDVAILRAMGMRLRGVIWFFLFQGAVVGFCGIGFGTLLGLLVCHAIERFQPSILSEAIYNVTRLPIHVDFSDVAIVSAVAFVLCLVFSLIPALRAAAARPVDALRYE